MFNLSKKFEVEINLYYYIPDIDDFPSIRCYRQFGYR